MLSVSLPAVVCIITCCCLYHYLLLSVSLPAVASIIFSFLSCEPPPSYKWRFVAVVSIALFSLHQLTQYWTGLGTWRGGGGQLQSLVNKTAKIGHNKFSLRVNVESYTFYFLKMWHVGVYFMEIYCFTADENKLKTGHQENVSLHYYRLFIKSRLRY